jgi:hypothetical protein
MNEGETDFFCTQWNMQIGGRVYGNEVFEYRVLRPTSFTILVGQWKIRIFQFGFRGQIYDGKRCSLVAYGNIGWDINGS